VLPGSKAPFDQASGTAGGFGVDLVTVATTFAVIFLAELPDKSLFASLVLSTRYRAIWVWLGVSLAFIVHVVIAVTAGHFLSLLPHRAVEGVVALLFTAGAVILLLPERSSVEDEPVVTPAAVANVPAVIFTSFAVVFVGEWGDLTQIATANLAAKYGDPLSVGVGAALGLVTVAGLATAVGSNLLRVVPVRVVRRIAGLVLAGFAVFAVSALLH
jgi:putative Ca2+/H+ antiporter (TMEM165/GDT1 family)